jgi:hypothetical protein
LLAATGSGSLHFKAAEYADTPSTNRTLTTRAATVSHTVSLVFDKVHFKRDNLKVPSDLEQMWGSRKAR